MNTMLLAAVVAVCIAIHTVASASTEPLLEKVYYDIEDAKDLFKYHVTKYNRHYNEKEYNKRLDIFKQSLKRINELNAKFPQTEFGVTHFADLTPEEVKSYHGCIPSKNTNKNKTYLDLNFEPKPAPDSFDWRDHGAVTAVKDQGHCGSCYVFSAIGNIEGQYAIKHKQCIQFSEQQCLDCLPIDGCKGGYEHQVMKLLVKKAGCMKEEDYPYLAKDHQQCREEADKVVAKVTGGGLINITDAEDLKQKLYNIGPLSIELDSSDFGHYQRGVLHPDSCSSDPTKVSHAVLLIGYGEVKFNKEKYWIIKNSWGDDWGEMGFLRISRGVNACGMEADSISTSVVA